MTETDLDAAIAEGEVGWYELQRIKPLFGSIATATTVTCSLCNRMISGMSGPGDGPLCLDCGDALALGDFRGAVKWFDDDDNLGGDKRSELAKMARPARRRPTSETDLDG